MRQRDRPRERRRTQAFAILERAQQLLRIHVQRTRRLACELSQRLAERKGALFNEGNSGFQQRGKVHRWKLPTPNQRWDRSPQRAAGLRPAVGMGVLTGWKRLP